MKVIIIFLAILLIITYVLVKLDNDFLNDFLYKLFMVIYTLFVLAIIATMFMPKYRYQRLSKNVDKANERMEKFLDKHPEYRELELKNESFEENSEL